MLPRAVRDLTQELTKLPGIGPKTAERLALHLLRQPAGLVAKLADTVKELHANVHICSVCFNLAEHDVCEICRSEMRNKRLLCVVEDALDVEAIERTGAYDGLYHVLGGVLSPINGVGPDQLTLSELFERLKNREVDELVIALDHKMESDVTSRYIVSQLADQKITISRLARGLPTGGDIEFADAMTLTAAINSRRKV
ncbi:MAG: recombination mediator RecR [bacterium]|nr:recombination mediator RecR [bacterium]